MKVSNFQHLRFTSGKVQEISPRRWSPAPKYRRCTPLSVRQRQSTRVSVLGGQVAQLSGRTSKIYLSPTPKVQGIERRLWSPAPKYKYFSLFSVHQRQSTRTSVQKGRPVGRYISPMEMYRYFRWMSLAQVTPRQTQMSPRAGIGDCSTDAV